MMTTMIIDIQSNGDAEKIAAALRLMKSVKRISMQEDRVERISGVPCTQEELIESVTNAVTGYRLGEKGMSQKELREEIATWK